MSVDEFLSSFLLPLGTFFAVRMVPQELRAMRAAVKRRVRLFRCVSALAYALIAALLLASGFWILERLLLEPIWGPLW